MPQLFRIAAITDEFVPDITQSVASMKEIGMTGAELRMVFGRNIIDLTDGELDRAKRIDLLIQAAARVDMDVVIAGEGPDRQRLESLANGRARFTGRVTAEELADLFVGRIRAENIEAYTRLMALAI